MGHFRALNLFNIASMHTFTSDSVPHFPNDRVCSYNESLSKAGATHMRREQPAFALLTAGPFFPYRFEPRQFQGFQRGAGRFDIA